MTRTDCFIRIARADIVRNRQGQRGERDEREMDREQKKKDARSEQ